MTRLKLTPFPTLITDRLVLRKLVESDKNKIYTLRSNEHVNTFIHRPNQLNIEDVSKFIDRINKGIEDRKWIYWAISLKNLPELIGTICLWNFSEDYKITEIGYELLPSFQHHGYMNEAVLVVIDYACHILDVKRIEAISHKDNIASRKLLERNNFQLNQSKTSNENPSDVIYFLINNKLYE